MHGAGLFAAVGHSLHFVLDDLRPRPFFHTRARFSHHPLNAIDAVVHSIYIQNVRYFFNTVYRDSVVPAVSQKAHQGFAASVTNFAGLNRRYPVSAFDYFRSYAHAGPLRKRKRKFGIKIN